MPQKTVEVFIPRGPVQRNKVLQLALAQVRDELPPTLSCDAEITGATSRPDDHETPGTVYEVTIDYTERGAGANHSVLPVGTFAASFGGEDDEQDRDGVDKALDATDVETLDALKAVGQAPSGV
ncbi:Uncharacterised protein [Mycobacteroides abscessus subsp. massiliense]|uniref:hypothetical protein n=1 Tax=Mycobacteroides abscessus TaxID=36809 RepID=UPI0009A91253|nr:hypothetical protein [Mycobacteroides abscessus]SKU71886.1 Uncharacterised protein [Mycobacteroides abscessus subsp. massiliense]SKV04147.1 Uncharacterised protein [Mycobacteroides abscessus subsp. massiliense]